MVFHLHHCHADGVQKPHLGLGEFNLLDQGHQVLKNGWCKRQETSRREFERLKDLLQLPSGSDADHQVIQRILPVEEMLEDLIDGVLVQLARFHRHPLGQEHRNSSAEKIVSLFLDLNFGDEGRLEEIVEIQVLFQTSRGQSNGRI
jgi:hypothetical protein